MEQHVAAEAKSVHAKLEDLEAVLAEDRSLEAGREVARWHGGSRARHLDPSGTCKEC